jgi:hypothetical protein
VITMAVAISWRLMAGAPLQRLVLLAAAITAIAPVWTVRPHVFSLLLLMSVVQCGVRERYWPLPLIFFGWANLHGGVAMGSVALCAIAVSRVYRLGTGEARRMMLLVAVCFAATVLTPLGTSLWSNIPESVHKSTQNGIVEWRAPVLLSASNLAFWMTAILLLGSVAARLRSNQRETTTADAVLITVSLALLPLALRYSRNIPPFLLVALPAVTRLLAPILARWRTGPKRELTGLNTALAAACLAVCFAVVSNAWSAPAARLKWRPIPATVVDEVRACGGRLYNRYDDGGYLIWFAAGVPVFVDSRQDPYPLELLQEHLFSETSGSYRQVFDRYRLTCAVLPEWSPTAAQLATDGWHTRITLDGWVVLQAPVANPGAVAPSQARAAAAL